MIHMEYYLVLSTIMMFVGIYGFVTRRNLLAMLISVELILNSVDINFVVFNRFLRKRKIGAFFLALLGSGLMAGTIGALSGAAPWFIGGEFYIAKMTFASAMTIILLLGFVALLSGIIGLVMRGFITWYGEIRIKEELTNRNTEMELSLVKSQINPHFLYNMLQTVQ